VSPADPPEVGSAIFRIRAPVDGQQAAEVYRSAAHHLSRKDGKVSRVNGVGRVSRVSPTLTVEVEGTLDLSVVDVLARLELMSRRHHARLRIRVVAAGHEPGNEGSDDPLEQLPALLGYLGLAGVLAARLEPRRESEPGE